ncbi:MAG: hypothetical protein CMQ16_06740 [Gammaproteobacteria bacterium]|nr:hypothetical protein [Gammaproteobacteria bacterium]
MMEPIKTIELDDDSVRWIAPGCQSRSLNQAMLRLLCDEGSLTQQLIEVSNGCLCVQTVELAWRNILGDDLRRLFGPVAPSHEFWSRKTVLLCEGKPAVLAHSLMPAHAAESALGEVLELGEHPLGGYLFSQTDVKRGAFQFAKSEQGFWGRRRIFYLDSKPIMVAEFFLPGETLDRLLRRHR